MPNLSKINSVGSDTASAREDFDGGTQFGYMNDSDTCGFNISDACFPVYECDVAELGGDDSYDAREDMINLFTLRMFHSLHLVFRHLSATGAIGKLKLKNPTYFFANNHDWNPFLLFIYDTSETYEPLNETGPTRVEHLQDWLDGMREMTTGTKAREEFLCKVEALAPKILEQNLLSMPILSDADGNSMEFGRDELIDFGMNEISDPRIYRQISFEAFAHLFHYILGHENANTYVLQTSMTFLFVCDPERAYELIVAVVNDKPDKKSGVLDCARIDVQIFNYNFLLL